ncbi:nuclear transport factor 2 family protein [Altericista sp. CCNU0014]|uniref:nuclear transport factor 2 family protein n=1 Tax=Altericista sp. CCNU0014 TaxID=3082949 RepID=UPI00384E065D
MNGKKLWQWQQQRSLNLARASRRCSTIEALAAALGSAALILGSGQLPSGAATPPSTPAPAATTPVPPAIAALIGQLDNAASRKDLEATMKFYGPGFTHADGLDFKTQQQALKLFWQEAKSIQYQTQIDRVQAQGPNRYVLETTTTLRGVRKSADRDMDLTATVRSRLTLADSKIVAQEILSEQTRLTSGDKPPNVNITLPEQVSVGQTFSFDAVVKEPLGEDLLLGSALEEPISVERYLQPAIITLEPLTAGGIFKTAQAPQQPTRKWISAVLIKNGGMTIVSQRLNVVRPNGSATSTPR